MTNNDDLTNDPIIETEAVDEKNADGHSMPVLSLESMIKNALPRVDKLKEEIKTKKEMLDDALNNDETYKTHSEKVKEAAKIRNATKKQLLSQPSLQILVTSWKDLRDELKELQASLSDYASEYARLSGTNEIEDANGVVCEIVYTARLVKRK